MYTCKDPELLGQRSDCAQPVLPPSPACHYLDRPGSLKEAMCSWRAPAPSCPRVLLKVGKSSWLPTLPLMNRELLSGPQGGVAPCFS